MKIKKLTQLILGALLLAFATGCSQNATDNNNSSGTNAPAMTNQMPSAKN
jgi:hypothetical protein